MFVTDLWVILVLDANIAPAIQATGLEPGLWCADHLAGAMALHTTSTPRHFPGGLQTYTVTCPRLATTIFFNLIPAIPIPPIA